MRRVVAAALAATALVAGVVPAARAGNGPGEGCVLGGPTTSCTYTATQVASFAGSGRFEVVVTYGERTRYQFVNPGGFFSSWDSQSLMDPYQIGIGDTVTARLLESGAGLAIGNPAALPHTPQAGTSAPPPLKGDIRPVHDPAIAATGRRYYVFSTGPGLPIRWSKDLRTWHAAGSVFPTAAPAWATDLVGAHDVWAPDVSFVNGRWHLYYAVSTFGSRHSAIGLATAERPGGPWTDHGPVLRSSDTSDFNAIDPNLVLDGDGRPWLAFGSFYTGIKLVPLDDAGRPVAGVPPIPLAANPQEYTGVEAAFIVERGGWYYLFASYAYCCRGVHSTYDVRVGRARSVAGPYLDDLGVPLLVGGGREVISARGSMRGPGHNAVLRQAADRWSMVVHYYDAAQDGTPTLGILPMRWTADGWPVVD